MLQDLFKGGSMEMSVEPLELPADVHPLWGDCMVNRISVIVFIILFILEFSDLFRLYKPLFRCLVVWKGNLDIEHSVSLARTRNTVSLVMAMGLCLICDRWGLTAPSFKTALPAEWQLAVSTAMIAGYMLLRRLLYVVSKFRSPTNEYAATLRHSVNNYQILLTSLMLVSCLLFKAPGFDDMVIRIVLIIEAMAFTLLHLVRVSQIFASRCSLLATFLYLCALEILPLGVLAFVCTL